jgi:hypothetical protein
MIVRASLMKAVEEEEITNQIFDEEENKEI